jgi:hypothetical protein
MPCLPTAAAAAATTTKMRHFHWLFDIFGNTFSLKGLSMGGEHGSILGTGRQKYFFICP